MNENSKFIAGKIKFNKKGIATIQLSSKTAKALYGDTKGEKQVYYAIIGGILQVAPNMPDSFIPAFNVNKESFIAQS